MSTVTKNEAGLPVLEHRAGPVKRPTCARETFMTQVTPSGEPEMFFLPGPPSPTPKTTRVLKVVMHDDDPIGAFTELLNNFDDFEQERRLYAFLFEHLPLLAVSREIEDEQAARDFGSAS